MKARQASSSLRKLHTDFPWLRQSVCPPAVHEASFAFLVRYVAVLTAERWNLSAALICVSVVAKEAEHVLMFTSHLYFIF